MEISYPYEDYPTVGAGAVTEAEYAEGIGWASPSGLIGSTSDPSPLLLSGGVLYLRAGTAARLIGMAYLNKDTDLAIGGIGSNGGAATRPDRVVLRLNWSTMLVRAAVLTGVPGGTLPGLTQQRGSGSYEISVGQVNIPAGGSLTNATLTRQRWYIGPDGQLLCWSDSRPPHSPGRRIWEADTGRWQLSTGVDPWRVLHDDSGWLNCTVASGWSVQPSGRVKARRRNGQIHVRLDLFRTGGRITSGAVKVADLPSGMAPSETEILPGSINEVGGTTRFLFNPDRSILIERFTPIDTGNAISVAHSFPLG
ncbi:hypothetical protein AB0873_15040 [Micromonospora sp. NPDC047707]|uniref:hypothetical protein n=1 Tax=Micromonospora sp. NPDC047707 TaxID=3154498 RepID=UPI0034533F7E